MQNSVKFLIEAELNSYKYSSKNEFLQKRFDYANNLYAKDLKAHYSCVNAVEFSNGQSDYFISGGDDKRILLWNVNNDILGKTCHPVAMKTLHNSNIFALCWNNENSKIFSGANDHNVFVHDVKTGQLCDMFLHDNAIFSISVHPEVSEVFATACESGEISLYDLRLSNSDPMILASSRMSTSSSSSNSSSSFRCAGGAFHTCEFNPIQANLLAIGNEISGLSLLDIRMNRPVVRYKASSSTSTSKENLNENNSKTPMKKSSNDYKQMIMSCHFNQSGNQLSALRGNQRPVIYSLNEPSPIFLFDHEDYKNNCTLKSFCLAGDQDQYFVSGSDDFSVFVWKIPKYSFSSNDYNLVGAVLISDVHLKLEGHRSIVNQCRYNYKYNLLATCGVEKLIKVWSTYEMPGLCKGGLAGKPEEFTPKRKLYTTKDLFSFNSASSNSSTSNNSGSDTANRSADPYDVAISNYEPVIRNRYNTIENEESIEEDKVTIAFFDSQVRRQRRIQDKLTKKERLSGKRLSIATNEDSDDLSVIDETDLESSLSGFFDDSNTVSSSSTSDKSDEITNESNLTTTTTTSSNSETDEENSNSFLSEFTKKNRKKAKREVTSANSLLSNSESSSYSSSSDDITSVEKSHETRSSKNRKKRNRLISLRHRRSLNLTTQSDYLGVLDSLNVERSDAVTTTSKNQETESSMRQESVDFQNPQIEIAKTGTKEFFQEDIFKSTSSLENLPTTSKKANTAMSIVKNLNKQKEKIQLDKEDDVVTTKNASHYNASFESSNEKTDSDVFKSNSDSNLSFNKNNKKRTCSSTSTDSEQIESVKIKQSTKNKKKRNYRK